MLTFDNAHEAIKRGIDMLVFAQHVVAVATVTRMLQNPIYVPRLQIFYEQGRHGVASNIADIHTRLVSDECEIGRWNHCNCLSLPGHRLRFVRIPARDKVRGHG